jgi:hypothetical protein
MNMQSLLRLLRTGLARFAIRADRPGRGRRMSRHRAGETQPSAMILSYDNFR